VARITMASSICFIRSLASLCGNRCLGRFGGHARTPPHPLPTAFRFPKRVDNPAGDPQSTPGLPGRGLENEGDNPLDRKKKRRDLMITAFDHAHIYCGDMEKMAAYFKDIFDARVVQKDERMTRLEVKGTIVNLMIMDPKAEQFETGKGRRGLDHLAFVATEIESTVEELKKKGVTMNAELKTMAGGTKVVFIDGPEGIRIELLQRP
jgi:lactoylglutathione lyase